MIHAASLEKNINISVNLNLNYLVNDVCTIKTYNK